MARVQDELASIRSELGAALARLKESRQREENLMAHTHQFAVLHQELAQRTTALELSSAALTTVEQERDALRVAVSKGSSTEKRLIELRERFSEAVAGRDDWERRSD